MSRPKSGNGWSGGPSARASASRNGNGLPRWISPSSPSRGCARRPPRTGDTPRPPPDPPGPDVGGSMLLMRHRSSTATDSRSRLASSGHTLSASHHASSSSSASVVTFDQRPRADQLIRLPLGTHPGHTPPRSTIHRRPKITIKKPGTLPAGMPHMRPIRAETGWRLAVAIGVPGRRQGWAEGPPGLTSAGDNPIPGACPRDGGMGGRFPPYRGG